MKWGARALGHRSILASPIAPHVLDNLNVFLEHREPHRPSSLSVCVEDLDEYFAGPQDSPLMEHEYVVRNPPLFAGVMPSPHMRTGLDAMAIGTFWITK
jgi:predicted NodU family carbamoyl transferase